MRQISLYIILLFITSTTLLSQEYGLYFMPEVWNASYLNPGLMPRQNVIVSLPSFHTSANAIGLNNANLLRQDNETEGVYYLNYAEIIRSLDRDVTLKMSSIVDAMAVGVKVNKFFFSLNTNTCIEGDFTAPQDFFKFIWEGTANHLDTRLDIGPTINLMAYQKIGLGANYTLKPNLSVGLRLNRLIGLGSLETQNTTIAITQNSEIYQTQFEVDYLVNYYAAGALEPIDLMADNASDFNDQLGEFELGSDGIGSITNKNNGWSVDLGAEYFPNKKWSFAASVTNLGSINWKNKTQRIHITEDYTYNGLETNDITDNDGGINFETVRDTLENILDFEAVSNQSYQQGLAPRTYFSARYQPVHFATIGGLLYNEFTPFGVFTGLSLSTRFQLGRVLSVGGLYTVQSGTYNNLGLNTALQLGPVQIHAVVDNISPIINPERVDGTNFRLGLNLTFGRQKQDDAIARNLDSLHRAQFYADTADDLEMDDEQAVSPTEEAPASDYVLQTSFKDLQTEAFIDLAHIVIFRLDAAGNKIFVRTDSYNDDQLNIVMNASKDQHELTATATGYEPLKFTFVPFTGNEVDTVYFFRKEGYEDIPQKELTEVTTDVKEDIAMGVTEEVATDITEEVTAETTEEVAAEVVSSPTPIFHSDNEMEHSPIEEIGASSNTATPIVHSDNEAKNLPIEEIDASSSTATNSPAAEEQLIENTTPTYNSPYTLPSNTYTPPQNEFYYVTQRTSLRSHATSQSDVLRRLDVDTKLKLLEKTHDHWWYVSYNGREGWVKAHLLQR